MNTSQSDTQSDTFVIQSDINSDINDEIDSDEDDDNALNIHTEIQSEIDELYDMVAKNSSDIYTNTTTLTNDDLQVAQNQTYIRYLFTMQCVSCVVIIGLILGICWGRIKVKRKCQKIEELEQDYHKMIEFYQNEVEELKKGR